MAEFLSAGVFIEERKSAAQAVQGVSTSTFATVGWLPRGPENKPVLVGSLNEYFSKFGGYWSKSDVPLAVTAYFSNGGARLYVVRVVPSDSVAASATVATNLWKFDAASRGTWGNLMRVVLAGNSNAYDTATATYSLFDVVVQEESAPGKGDWVQKEFYEAVDLVDDEGAQGILTVLNDSEAGSEHVKVTKLTGGIPAAFASTAVSAEALGTGAGGANQTVSVTLASDPVAPFTLKIKQDGVVVAQDDGRGRIVPAAGSTFTSITGSVNYATGVLSAVFTPGVTLSDAITADYYQKGVESAAYTFAGGAEGTAVDRSLVTDPALQAAKHGIYALDLVDDMLSLGLPDFRGNMTVHGDLLSYCEAKKDRFAILDTKAGIDAQDAVNYKRVTLGSLSSYGAMYYPGLKVADPLKNGRPKVISPVGHIAGVYARTDNNRNVGKAPAGVDDGALNFTLGLERDLTQAERDILYPANVNPLISTPQTGRAVWGARTLQNVGDFNLVNVRRLFMFLEKSFFNTSQDLVFEPISEELFGRIVLRYGGFLTGLTDQGYFASKNPAEAFRIICDGTNNSPASIAARQVICDVLIAAANPAEFIRFRFERALNTLA